MNHQNKKRKIMERSKLYAAMLGICIGCVMGYVLAMNLMKRFENCKHLENENRMLRDMLFNQQDPYRPDTTQKSMELERPCVH